MMVPTLVRFGRLTDGCACPVSTVVAVATTDIMSVPYPALTPGGAVRSVSPPCPARTAHRRGCRTGVDGVSDGVASAHRPRPPGGPRETPVRPGGGPVPHGLRHGRVRPVGRVRRG